MNIVCVYSADYFFASPSKPLFNAYEIPFGLASIITVLEKSGHNVELFVFNPKSNLKVLEEYIKNKKPELACFSSVFTQYHFIREIAGMVKLIDPTIRTVIGGTHATLNPEIVINEPCFDAVCVGEGENAMVKMAENLERGIWGDVNNIWFKGSIGEIQKNPQDEFIQDIDNIPYINRKIWSKWILNYKDNVASILVGRGCAFRCSYCCNHSLAKVASGKYLRLRSVENVIGEIKSISNDFPNLKTIYFEIETLSLHFDYMLELCDALKKLNEELEHPLAFGTNFTVTKNLMSRLDTAVEKLKEANFMFINAGLESGSPEIRKTLRRPEYDNEDMVLFCNKLQERGIDVNLYVLIGLPDETPEHFEQTIEVTRKCLPRNIMMSIFFPYPGTDLYQYSKEKGYLQETEDFKKQTERLNVFLNSPHFSKNQIIHEYRKFPSQIYKGIWPLPRITLNTIDKTLFTNTALRPLYIAYLNKVSRLSAWFNNRKMG